VLIVEAIIHGMTPFSQLNDTPFFKKSSVWIGAVVPAILGFVIIGLIHPTYAKIQYPKWEKRKKEIEQKEHLEPIFISWEEKVHLSSFSR
jgi:hypothetical protein